MTHELSYMQIKTANQVREAEEQKIEQRRKSLLVLILQYLNDEGYVQSAKCLETESSTTLNKFQVCDNVDLPTILQEYESYYYVKFNKYPKIIKKVSAEKQAQFHSQNSSISKNKGRSNPLPKIPPSRRPSDDTAAREPRDNNSQNRSLSASSVSTKKNSTNKKESVSTPEAKVESDLGLTGVAVQSTSSTSKGQQKLSKTTDSTTNLSNQAKSIANTRKSDQYDPSERLLKPISTMIGYSNEMKELVGIISREIYLHNPNVRWSDIIGLEKPIKLVKESVVYPIKYPQLFSGILSPWKGLLLYGPPGTGKTMLAKAVATECNTTFFNISASSIVSKWRGDSEKLVRVLFELARHHAPSTIFLDEIESLMGQRGSAGISEHEGSRRMKTELLIQMDGLARSKDLVFVLATSNIPWELDLAMLRRLEKRILIDLPTCQARKAMFRYHLPPVIQMQEEGLQLRTEVDYEMVAEATDGYSGSDIHLVCKEAAMRSIRKIFDVLESIQLDGESSATQLSKALSIDPITTQNVFEALKDTKPSASGFKDKYKAWQAQFESTTS
ncbi:Katanin p60 ATPase-containing subunit A-like 2 [Trichoplax sp. H2]|nr:Katanin p60 ATPase-containing subunit A-like 2 [Trichoplax sp. H2]|eukprot:RDD43721.1 Katanin p60 ATPase-containing subunit A-like 2 [Trichoplax sp. H2]